MASLFVAKAKRPARWLLKSAKRLVLTSRSKVRQILTGQAESPDLQRQPLVSILLVTYNSECFLPRIQAALSTQTYRHFELICVDNASTDQTLRLLDDWQRAPTSFPITLLPCATNTGYAAGVNLAYQHASGEFLALLNADAEPGPNWLLEMVNALSRYPGHSAVSPKILFDSPFSCFTLHFDRPLCLDLKVFVDALPYPKLFVREGELRYPDQICTNAAGWLVLELPAFTDKLCLRLSSRDLDDAPECDAGAPTLVSLFPAGKAQRVPRAQLSTDSTLSLSLQPFQAPAYWLINNAGSTTGRWADNPYDVAFAVRDSPKFDRPSRYRLRRFCGCSVLIRRTALLDRDLFINEFFAYYEDSELSRWLLRNRRGPILYWPRAVLQHHHSSTLGEFSPAWSYLTARSRLLYRLVHQRSKKQLTAAKKQLPERLNQLAQQGKASGVDPALTSTITALDQTLLDKLHHGDSLVPYRRSIAVYNLFWNTYGGGEVHALQLARRLKDEHPDCHVYLLSESDFDLEALASYFNISTNGLLKLVVPRVTTKLTKRFWLFVNSTSHSSLASVAVNSWYIVSFPHRSLRRHWQKTYTFLPNSHYTQSWMQRWWGQHSCTDAQVFYPVAHLRSAATPDPDSCDRSSVSQRILAVGRLTRRGHAKNQDLILEAFLQIASSLPSAWQLCLAGSLDESNAEDLNYYQQLKECINTSAHSSRVALLPNVSRDDLNTLLHDSAFFVHAAGLGQSAQHEPELHEHFGIAPVEAALAGCVPIVYAVGGPAEVLQQTGCGHCFQDFQDLQDTLQRLCRLPTEAVNQQRLQTKIRTQQWLEVVCQSPLPPLQGDSK
ncbi:glycosyltransferase [Vulcanococcus limneticus]|uniref:glycosyltransferase n=1 Tax=Vulcanococcus limneticus TaxID=2170428 RepID=UPI00398BFFAE